MVYEWKKDATGPIGKVKAKDAGKILKKLEKQHGGVTPRSIILEAKPVKSPIHDWFEWDNTVAAQRWREEQARAMVQQIVVCYDGDGDTEAASVRAFVSVVEDDCRHYASTARVFSNAELKQQVIDDVLSNISQCKEKLKAFTGFSNAIESLESARKQVRKKKTRRLRAG